MRVERGLFMLLIVASSSGGCSSSGGSPSSSGGVSSGGKAGMGGAGGAGGNLGGTGGTACSANQKCSSQTDCFPVSCLCPGMTSSVSVAPICSSGCCLDLKQVCDPFCAKDGGLGGSAGSGGAGGSGGGTAACDPSEGGVFTLVASDVESSNFALDANNVYFGSGHSLKKAPLGGGAPSDVAAGTWSGLIAVDTNTAYVVSVQEILAVPLVGGTATTLYQSTTSPPADALTVDATHAYFKDSKSSHLYEVPIAGGTPTDLASGLVRDSIVVDAANAYFTGLGEVDSVPIAGGTKKVLSGGGAPDALALDGGFVYYSDWASPQVRRFPVAGGTAVVLGTYAGNKGAPSIAVDATHVYAASADACSSVVRIPKAGGAAVSVAENQGSVRWVAVDDTSVYWLSWSQGSASAKLWRTAK